MVCGFLELLAYTLSQNIKTHKSNAANHKHQTTNIKLFHMLPIAWYLLKVMICSGILFGYYWLLLRNKIFHRYNRFYLLAAVVLSLLPPLVQINFWQQDQQHSPVIRVLQAVSSGHEFMNEVIIRSNQQHWSIQQLYPIIYLLISSIFIVLFLRSLLAVERAAILRHDFPERIRRDAAYTSPPTPVTVQHLKDEGLSPAFVQYMRQWPGFVEAEQPAA